MKECPHCHEESFGVRELFELDYFSPDQCKSCGKLVRNDGFRQFLTIPAILVALFLGFVVFALLPNSLQPFGFLLLIVLVALPVALLAKPVKIAYPKVELAPFIPDSKNDKVIMVKGWNEDELRKIRDDFIEEDLSGAPPYKIGIEKRYGNSFRLTFPQDIHPTVFTSLINYLTYPIDLGLQERSVTVVGKTTLNSAFGVSGSLVGEKAIIYVPENDEDYTAVYMQTEAGASFANSLDEMIWRPVDNARLSSEVTMLIS
jgi:hypothetical protein